MSEFTQKFFSVLLLVIIGFVVLNMYSDLKGYFYSKNLGIIKDIFKNNIII